MSGSRTYGVSETGDVRADNQDAIRWREPEDEFILQQHGLLYGIADGMGGYEHGGVASSLALETFFNAFYAGDPGKPTQNLKQGMQAANLAVFQASQRLGARMGTTLSAINIIGNEVSVAHIGDSRVYRVNGRKAVCLTNDHTAVGELVRMRVLSPDKVRKHERRSILQKCLGMELFVQPDISRHVVQEGDYLILCTDGIWAYVEDDEFAEAVTQEDHPEQVGTTLLQLAKSRESDDNLSVMVIHVQQFQTMPTVVSSGGGLRQLFRNRLYGKS